jgi:phage gpG-like protein
MRIRVEVTGSKEVQAKLTSLGKKLERLDNAMRRIGDQLSRYYANDAFNSQGGVFNNNWPALADSTIKSRLHASRRGGSILSRSYIPLVSGQPSGMRDSFTYAASSSQVVVGNSKDYFKYHQSSREPRTRLPRRQMIGVNTRVKEIVRDNIQREVEQKLREM